MTAFASANRHCNTLDASLPEAVSVWADSGDDMITLYTFGPMFGLPDPSPFVLKAMLLLKMAGLDYVEDCNGFRNAPKGKLPFIDDDGQKVPDSTFIRLHIEKKYGFDYDAGLTPEQKAIGWMIEKTVEDHLYFLGAAERWMDDDNFAKGPARFFEAAPPPLRPLLRYMIRGKVRKVLHGQGLYRHSAEERRELARRGLSAASTLLGDKPFAFGDEPHGADATLARSARTLQARCERNSRSCPISSLTRNGSRRDFSPPRHEKRAAQWGGPLQSCVDFLAFQIFTASKRVRERRPIGACPERSRRPPKRR
jgi:glutathione S-transferase